MAGRRERVGVVRRLAERFWKLPFVGAAVVFVGSGPLHARGLVDAVFYASLVGMGLGAIGVALGWLALGVRRNEVEPR